MAGKLVKRMMMNDHVRISFCPLSPRARLHESAYEKQVEDSVVEDVVSHKPAEEEYWEPDPETGVFKPASEQNTEEPALTCTTEETVLDEKAFFRPQEDLEPPPPQSFTGETPLADHQNDDN